MPLAPRPPCWHGSPVTSPRRSPRTTCPGVHQRGTVADAGRAGGVAKTTSRSRLGIMNGFTLPAQTIRGDAADVDLTAHRSPVGNSCTATVGASGRSGSAAPSACQPRSATLPTTAQGRHDRTPLSHMEWARDTMRQRTLGGGSRRGAPPTCTAAAGGKPPQSGRRWFKVDPDCWSSRRPAVATRPPRRGRALR